MTIGHGLVICVEGWATRTIDIGSVVELLIRNAGVPGLIPGPTIYIVVYLLSPHFLLKM